MTNIPDRFLETLRDMKNAVVAEGTPPTMAAVVEKDRSQASATLNFVDKLNSGELTNDSFVTSLQTAIDAMDSTTMSKTVSEHVLNSVKGN